jgi:UDP-glucose 4-epimerase
MNHPMRILVTGSSGWLGRCLVPRLERDGHEVIGLDPLPAETTRVVGSVADAELVRAAVRDHGIEAVVHAGALHKPNLATHGPADFVAVNVKGTLNLLKAAVVPESAVDRFVFTSTTSLMIAHDFRARAAGRAAWITEEMQPLCPRNIYGVTKLAAEHLCRMYHEAHGLSVVTLRTARFFPAEDDMAHAIAQSGPNTKVNELLFRRLTVEDAAEAHVAALGRAPALGLDTFIVSAPTPFSPQDCAGLMADAPAVVARYFPRYPEVYAAGLEHVRVDRPRLRRGTRHPPAGVHLPDGVQGEARRARRRGGRRPVRGAGALTGPGSASSPCRGGQALQFLILFAGHVGPDPGNENPPGQVVLQHAALRLGLRHVPAENVTAEPQDADVVVVVQRNPHLHGVLEHGQPRARPPRTAPPGRRHLFAGTPCPALTFLSSNRCATPVIRPSARE